MKKVLTLAAVIALAACGEKKAATPAADSTAMMQHDTGMSMQQDTTSGMSHDSMARDTTKKP